MLLNENIFVFNHYLFAYLPRIFYLMTFDRSSKNLKMEAYDAAVLSYALASATYKDKPPALIGLPSLPHDSLTPPREASEEVDGRNYLYQLLFNLEQMLLNKTTVQLSHLMEVCSTKQSQVQFCC